MPLSPGVHVGSYEILSPLGEGGMGTVYRARDTRLPRDVAIKCMRAERALDPEARHRAEREARIIARLVHPNICTLHDIVQGDDETYLVMEVLDGETLGHRLARVPGGHGLPVTQCLGIAASVADALACAHEQGIVHQDVKPANIMLTTTGVKLLDFGVARMRRAPDGDAPTITASMDRLARAGTLPYMAPEQLDGAGDARSDLFALGAVLFEMLSGRRAFPGETSSQVIAGILEPEPPVMSGPGISPSLARVLRRCLAKQRHERWQSAQDLADELRWLAIGPADGPRLSGSSSPPRTPRRWLTAGAVAVVAAASAVWMLATPTPSEVPPTEPLRVDLSLPAGLQLTVGSPPALSRDGRHLAFVAGRSDAPRQIHVRDLETGAVSAVTGTDGAEQPFWSPDARTLAFFADGKLKRVAREGGSAQTIAERASMPRGGDWSTSDVILYVPDLFEGAIWRVSAGGDTPRAVVEPDRDAQEQSLLWPRFLPDGRAFLYVRDSSRAGEDALLVRSLEIDDATVIRGVASAARLVDAGHLLFVRDGWLVTQPYDVAARRLSGTAVPIVGPLRTTDYLGAMFDAHSQSRIVYQPHVPLSVQLGWYDRRGGLLEEIGQPEAGLLEVRLGRGDTLVSGHIETDQTDLWVGDLQRKTQTRLTATHAWESGVTMSPDGQQLAFGSDVRGTFDLYVSPMAPGAEQRLLASAPNSPLWPSDWSRDGLVIVGTGVGTQTMQDVWAYAIETGALTWLVRTRAREGVPQVSQDGTWFAYQSDESGQFEVYVARMDRPSERWRVTSGGGGQPRWRGDGRELYYLRSGEVYAVDVKVRGPEPTFGAPTRLFVVPGLATTQVTWWSPYDVSTDGQRFLIARPLAPETADRLAMVVGWRPPPTRE